MKQTFEDYRCQVVENAERFAQREEVREREDHLRAFNFGRMVERIQNAPRRARRRVPWLLVGLAIGIACGRLFPNDVYHTLANRLLTHMIITQKTAGKTGVR